jgi:hypothetical protein
VHALEHLAEVGADEHDAPPLHGLSTTKARDHRRVEMPSAFCSGIE